MEMRNSPSQTPEKEFASESEFLQGIQPYAFEPQKTSGLSENDNIDSDYDDNNPEVLQSSRIKNLSWCTCLKCVSMNNPLECLCCNEIQVFRCQSTLASFRCITDNPEFDMVCLNREVNEVALLTMHELRGDSILTRPLSSRTYRLSCYRQFTLWARGKLGRKVRFVIPACVTNKIRENYPEASGKYTGFSYSSSGESALH